MEVVHNYWGSLSYNRSRIVFVLNKDAIEDHDQYFDLKFEEYIKGFKGCARIIDAKNNGIIVRSFYMNEVGGGLSIFMEEPGIFRNASFKQKNVILDIIWK